MPEKIKQIPIEVYRAMNNTSYPRGLYYTPRTYIAIDNQNGTVIDREFDDLQECMDWLRGRMRNE